MNLILDFGNTLIKAAVFNSNELVRSEIFNSSNDLLSNSSLFQNINHCIVSSVNDSHQSFLSSYLKKINILEFTSKRKIPILNKYESTQTLGSDRIAASIGAFSISPNKNTLVIDAGTCLKFNFTNDRNEFIGGSISPGLEMRFKALRHFTGKLPLLEIKEDYNKLVGQNTEESILSGVINGIIAETDSIINEYKKLYPELTIFLTGGDAAFFEKRLKSSIFVDSHLVLTGLNQVLKFNL